ncbi:hypothetical protein QFZ27_000156 [Inquilinus ginsengisoli]|uniref:hypothetical protein n=1 Tax=Inquilinus ginsengisoli TaxID=363840 RepID=UPI003D243165
MKNTFSIVISIASLAIATITLMATVSPDDLLGNLAKYVPARSILVPLMVLALSALCFEAGRRIGALSSRKAKSVDQRLVQLVLNARLIHDNLLSYGTVDMGEIAAHMSRIERSDHPIWVDQKAWNARAVFLRHAEDAAKARSGRQDFPTPMARSEAKDYLDNATERLIAALNKQRMPPLFDPYDGEQPSLWKRWPQRMKDLARRSRS